MTCQGEGGVEIYLEPMLAAPRLVILGHTPVAQSLARLGAELGFEVAVGSRGAAADAFPAGTRVAAEPEAALAGVGAGGFVVVATMGAGDEEALAAATASDAAYVGLVASRKKARFLIDYARANGASPERLARVKFPAGLDLGGMSAPEIALSVLAEIVQRRHPRQQPPAAAGLRPARALAMAPLPVDPVCGMPVDPAEARHTLVVDGATVYFCCPHCKAAYERSRRETRETTA